MDNGFLLGKEAYCYCLFCLVLLVFILGLNIFGGIVILQSLYNQFIENQKRGRYLAIMTMAVCVGLSIGPILVGFIGVLGFLALMTIPPTLLLLKPCAKIPAQRHVAFLYFIKRTPIVFIAKFTQEFIVASIFALGVVFLIRNNHSPKHAGFALSAFSESTIVDLGIGILADRFNKSKLISVGCIGIFACLGVLGIYADHFRIALAIFFVLGIFTGLMYISLTSLLNNRFPKKVLVSANATLHLIGNSGGIAGTLIVGGAMQFYGNYGFSVVLMGGALICLLVTLYYSNDSLVPKRK